MVPDQPKGGMNLYIELEKHMLDQIAARNIRVFLEKCIPFSRQSYNVSGEKRTRTNNMISVIRIYLLANSSNESRARHHVYNASKKNVHGKFCILPLESKYLET